MAANVSLPDPAGVKVVAVETTAELRDAVLAAASAADVVVMAAAPADFRPASVSEAKIKKSADGAVPSLELTQNPDILAELSAHRATPGQVVVGFAAESEDLLANAQAKRLRKGVPLLVGNLGPATFGQDDNALLLVSEQGVEELARDSKLALARRLVARCASMLDGGRTHAG